LGDDKRVEGYEIQVRITLSQLELWRAGHKGTLGEGVLKFFSGSFIVLKGIRCNNFY